MLLNQIIKFIRKYTDFTWGHIDDILIGHHSKTHLEDIRDRLLIKLNINEEKSVLEPTKVITFLGAIWDSHGVKRKQEITDTLPLVIINTHANLKEKKLQKIRGYLNYYLSFAKFFNSLLHVFLNNPNLYKNFLLLVVKYDYISFRKNFNRHETWYSDATESMLGITNNKKQNYSVKCQKNPIIITETLVALWALTKAKPFSNVHIFKL